MNDSSCNTMNSSTRIVVSGASSHSEGAEGITVDSKILMFVLSIQLIECYVINCIRS